MKKRMLLAANKLSFFKYLIAYYKMENNIDSISLTTDFDNSNFEISNGKINNGFKFTSAYSSPVRISSNKSRFSFTNGTNDIPFSFSFWINFQGTGSSGFGPIFGKSLQGSTLADNNYEYELTVKSNGQIFFAKYSNGKAVNYKNTLSSVLISKNVWKHIVVTDNTVDTKIYIDGVEVSTSVVNSGSGFVKFLESVTNNVGWANVLGAGHAAYELFATIDEFAVFKGYALTQSDIDYIYNNGNGKELR